MRYETSVSIEFDAGHTVPSEERCRTPHGHHWTCVATIKSSGTPAKQDDYETLRAALTEIRRQLKRRDLNAMLPGTIPNTLGVANWLWDQLVMKVPLLEVSVTADGASSSVHA